MEKLDGKTLEARLTKLVLENEFEIKKYLEKGTLSQFDVNNLSVALKSNTLIGQNLHALEMKTRLLGQIFNGLGVAFQTGMQLGYFLAQLEAKKQLKVN